LDNRDSEKMKKLAREGKLISKICGEDFPQYSYSDVYAEIYGGGERSAMGVKKMISSRLKKLPSLSTKEQSDLIDEINDLVWDLYNRNKESQQKLEDIRAVIER